MAQANITSLADGSNIAHWFLIINGWSDGFLMSGLLLIIALIVFTISKNSGTEDVKAFLGTSFAMFLISTAGFFVRWNDLQLVPVFMPLFFLSMAGLAALFSVVGNKIFNS